MSKIFETVKKRLQVWHEERAEKLEGRRQARLDAESRRVVQVMEFNGELYVSVYGIPLFASDFLEGACGGPKLETGGMASVVKSMRENYKDWKEEKLWEQSGTTDVSIRS